jgi:predicted DNA-binding transcriptional regulator YafY
MVKSYQPREDDLEDETIGDVRQVVRKVVNHFWLIREVARYWDECVIVSPASMRDRIKEKLSILRKLYEA